MNIAVSTLALAGYSLLTGCGSLTGFNARSSYACAAPKGVTCQSVSGVYHRTRQPNITPQRTERPTSASVRPGGPQPAASATVPTTAAPTGALVPHFGEQPLRSTPRILRLWVKPWIDSDDDLHDSGYVYLQVDAGRWLIGSNLDPIRQRSAAIRAPGVANHADPNTESRSSPTGRSILTRPHTSPTTADTAPMSPIVPAPSSGNRPLAEPIAPERP